MKKHGTLFECGRCTRVEFVEDGRDYFGLEAPFGWSFHDDKHLCPTCTEAYNTMMNNFYAPEVKRPLELDDSSREVVNGRVVL